MLRCSAVALLAVTMIAVVQQRATAGIVILAQEVAGNTVFTASGSANIADLAAPEVTAAQTSYRDYSDLDEIQFILRGTAGSHEFYDIPRAGNPIQTATPTNQAQLFTPDITHSGDVFGIFTSDNFNRTGIYLPTGYVSGAAINGTLTINRTLAQLDLADGENYTWNWGAGGNADSISINVSAVPEPSGLTLVGFGVAAIFLRRNRKSA